MADPVAASGAASLFRAGTVLRPPRPSLLDAVAHSAVLRALAAWRDNGGGQPPLLLDGTAGNGHDCLFLARQAPAGSLLLALDIQEAALQASRTRLEQAGMAARCCASAAAACALSPLPSGTTDIRLVLHSHAALPELLDALSEADRQRPLLAGIFNFGYLPGTDKRCTTTASGSLAAVDALLERLAPQGSLSLHCYTGLSLIHI